MNILNLSLISAQGVFCFSKIRNWSVMSVNHDVDLSCIQWRASKALPEAAAGQRSKPTLRWESVLRHVSMSRSGAKSRNIL